jgi:competence protein ComFC
MYPKVCLACKNKLESPSVDNLICAKCWNEVKRNTPPFCHFCGRHLRNECLAKNVCKRCLRSKLHFDRAFSPCVYEGVIKELIHVFKYKNKDYLGLPLSRLMIEFIREYNMPMDYLDFIIPVPLHKIRLREREFNQAQILSEYIAKEFNKTLLSGLLMRHRPTKTQTDLELNQRFLNVANSFSLRGQNDIKGKNLLLVDDVLTTAATSSEAARVLKDAGANIVFVLTLAN